MRIFSARLLAAGMLSDGLCPAQSRAVRNAKEVHTLRHSPGAFREAPLRTFRLILRQLRVMQRKDPIQNACIRVRATPRPAAEEETKDEQSQGLLGQAWTTILFPVRA